MAERKRIKMKIINKYKIISKFWDKTEQKIKRQKKNKRSSNVSNVLIRFVLFSLIWTTTFSIDLFKFKGLNYIQIYLVGN